MKHYDHLRSLRYTEVYGLHQSFQEHLSYVNALELTQYLQHISEKAARVTVPIGNLSVISKCVVQSRKQSVAKCAGKSLLSRNIPCKLLNF